jgi:hypothetical protein
VAAGPRTLGSRRTGFLGPPMATDNGHWDVVLFRYGMLCREHKTFELSTCFQTDEKTGEMNWDDPSAATTTVNYRWADCLKSCKMTLWEARAHLRPGIMLAKTSSFLEMGCRAMST